MSLYQHAAKTERMLKHECVAVLQAVQGANLDIRPLPCLERARGRHGADEMCRWAHVAEELFPDEDILAHLRALIAGGVDVWTHRSSTAWRSQVPRSVSPRESKQ